MSDQTIEYLHQDIQTLNARVNDLWAQLQASEDGSGLAALRVEKDAVELALTEARSERDSAMSMLTVVTDEKRELSNRVLELEALLAQHHQAEADHLVEPDPEG